MIIMSDAITINVLFEHNWQIWERNWCLYVMLLIVASLTDNSRGIIYDRNIFIKQAADQQLICLALIFLLLVEKSNDVPKMI